MAGVGRPAAPARVSSTVVGAVVAQAKAVVVTRSATAIKKIFFTEADMASPSRLYQVISKLQDFAIAALRQLGTSPLAQGTLLTNLTWTAGQTQYLAHRLGRPWVGMIAVIQQPGTTDPLIRAAALPPGVDPSMMVGITSLSAGVFSVFVF